MHNQFCAGNEFLGKRLALKRISFTNIYHLTRPVMEPTLYPVESALITTFSIFISNIFARASPSNLENLGINIVGGRETLAHHYPFIEDMILDIVHAKVGNRFHTCGATIINEEWVVTAAHCVQNALDGVFYEIVAGDHNLKVEEGTEQIRRVTQIINHEDYDPISAENDISLLKVNVSLAYNAHVSRLDVAPQGYQATGDVVAIGWGALKAGGQASETLQEVTVHVWDDTTCRVPYGNAVKDTMLCAGDSDGGRDSCQGDSGGPLVQNINSTLYLIGITSWGYGCADPGYPGVYTEVAYYYDWISERIHEFQSINTSPSFYV